MTEWQPIETAPKDGRTVLLGRWLTTRLGQEGLFWSEETGRVWVEVDGAFPWSRKKWVKTFDGDYYSHWKPLPEPPK